MGISGLTSFMKRECLDETLEEIKLNNSKLLVDGYSLLHKVHSETSLQSTHGGNYDELANSLSEIFHTFKKCSVEAIFLLDGGRDKSDRKIRTQLKRATQRIQRSCSITNYATAGNSKKAKFSKIDLESLINTNYQIFSSLLPILAFKIYIDLLKKFEILHFQCTFEADYDLACLANELKCPLLSCDSDFYVYDLKYGYISFEHFYLSSVTKLQDSDGYYIPGYIYKLDNFLKYINETQVERGDCFKKEMLPIFAVICGNDYVDKSIFSSLLKSFDSSNNNLRYKKVGKNPENYAKKKDDFYFKIISWLAQFKDSDECLDMILRAIKNSYHDLIRKVVDESIQEYLCKKTSFINYFKRYIINGIESELESLTLNDEISKLEISTFNGDLLKSDFLKDFIHFKTTRYCMDVLMHRKTMFACQIEIANWPSTYLSSVEIRKFYYTMLFKFFDSKSLNEAVIIEEYLRYQTNLKIYEINLSEENEMFLQLEPSLIDNIFILKNLFKIEDSIGSNLVSRSFSGKEMCRKLKFLFALIYFFLNSSKQNSELQVINQCKNINFIRAFIVSIIKLSIVDPCYSVIKNEEFQETDEIECIRKFEHQELCLINEYFSERQDTNSDFLFEIKNFIISNPKNFKFLKELRIKLVKFSQLFEQNLNISSKNMSRIDRLLDLKIVHCLSEFQAIYLSTFYAKTIMDKIKKEDLDFKILDLNNFFNGTFLHNFKDELDNRVNPDLFIEELLGRQSIFKCIYHELFGYFNEIFGLKVESFQTSANNTNLDGNSNTEEMSKKTKRNAVKNYKKKLKKMEAENLNINNEIKS